MSVTLSFIHIHLRFVVDKEALEPVLFLVLRFFLFGDIPAELLTYLHVNTTPITRRSGRNLGIVKQSNYFLIASIIEQ